MAGFCDHLRLVTLVDGDGRSQTLRTTDEHPFWSATIEDWICAGDLEPGMLCEGPNGERLTVESTAREEHPLGVPVYNFEVENAHTYFVQEAPESPAPLLVHNAKTSQANPCSPEEAPNRPVYNSKAKRWRDPDTGDFVESPKKAFHYTASQWGTAIKKEGLRPGSYATPFGNLSSLQAKLELALPPTKAAPNIRISIDLDGLRKAGYQIPTPTRVSSTVVGPDGRVYQMPGGGYEMQFPYTIPGEFLEVLPIL